MSGKPDPKPERQERRPRRVRDTLSIKHALLRDRECWACREEGANGHHLIPKDFTKPGPDIDWNIIALCGTGTMRCHGAFHGNPYTVQVRSTFPFEEGQLANAYRDKRWVADRIYERLSSVAEADRMLEVLRFLDTPQLIEQFFGRVLQLDILEIDHVLNRQRILIP